MAFLGREVPATDRESFVNAVYVNDLIKNCPQHWNQIIDIESVEIFAVCNGAVRQARSSNGLLNWEQKIMLMDADMNTEIKIKIGYRWKDASLAIGDYGTLLEMEFISAIEPSVEAEFPGGYQMARAFIDEALYETDGKKKISKNPGGVQVTFTVDENGKVAFAKIDKPSKDADRDKILLEKIEKMPVWTPAKNAKGEKVKQDFRLRSVDRVQGGDGC
jgi:TonB family protein